MQSILKDRSRTNSTLNFLGFNLSYNSKRNLKLIPCFVFLSNKSGSCNMNNNTFIGKIITDNGIGKIIYGNATIIYPNSALKKIKVYYYSGANLSSITRLQFPNFGILSDTLDLRKFTGVTDFSFNSNPGLKSVLFPSSTAIITSLSFYGCNLTGVLDLSTMANLSGGILFYSNPSLTNVTFPNTSRLITSIRLFSCNITGTLDLSGLTRLSGELYINGNPNLTQIIHPNSNDYISSYLATGLKLSSLDLSTLKLTGVLRVTSQSTLLSVTIPTLTAQFTEFNFSANALNRASIDAFFSKLNTFYMSNAPTVNLTVNTSLGTNAVPTGGANNTDILSLTTIFTNAGKVFSYSINI